MGVEKTTAEETIQHYKEDIVKLSKYIPWLETKSGRDVSSTYSGEGIEGHSISFPVYDGTLLAFVKEAQNTTFMNRNYVYTYSRNRIKTVQDEKSFIDRATIQNMQGLGDILSKYIMLGMTKASVWTEGVETRIFLDVITKMKELVEFWDKPLA